MSQATYNLEIDRQHFIKIERQLKMASLAEIRARLAASESKQGGNSSTGGDNAIYPHWNIIASKHHDVQLFERAA